MSQPNTFAAGRFQLRVIAGKDSGTVFPLTGERIHVGRGSNADVRIDEICMQRRHFLLLWDPSQRAFVLHEMKAVYPLYLNGACVESGSSAILRIGDVLTVEKTIIAFEERS